jgi:uncharacterized protein with NRDE domain
MCTLHLFYQVFPDEPVVFVANRDEMLDRAWGAPALLARLPRVYGPRDLVAGGTWLGVNEEGVLVSLANHEGTLRSGGSLCSRGAVVLETLRHGSAIEARRFAEWVAPACKAYTLLVADPEQAVVLDHGEGGNQTYRLLPGCHVITNARFRLPEDPKARRSLARMQELAARECAPTDAELTRFLADHEAPGGEATPLCIHPEPPSRFGTSSASVIRIGADRAVRRFLFAPGPPCRTDFQDVTPRWDSLSDAPSGGPG